MSSRPTAADLMSKAERASASARLLLNIGDTDGACNRAYYAMFDAARAALIVNEPSLERNFGKTHSGLLNVFSSKLIITGLVPKELGRLLKRAEGVRMVADYKGDTVLMSDAQEIVQHAELFVTEMKTLFGTGDSAAPV